MASQYQSSSKMSKQEKAYYAQTRRQEYPNTYSQAHPSEKAEKDYNTYSQYTQHANESTETYWKEYEKHTGAKSTPMATLGKGQHRVLAPSAAEAATNTAMNARARNNFLEEHPYAYQTARKRVYHEGLADRAFQDAAYYSARFGSHLEGSNRK